MDKSLDSVRTPSQREEPAQQRTEDLEALTNQLQLEIQQRAELAKALSEQESRLRMALGAGRMGTWDWDLSSGRVIFDAVQRELTGLDSDGDDFDAERFFERVHPEDLAELRAKIQRAVADGEEFNHEFRLQMADGQYRWLAGRGEVEFDERGKPCRMRGVNYDVTESHAAVEHLAENEAFLRSLLHSSADGIKVLDMEGRILSVNESAVRALEIEDADTLRGAVWRSFWPESMHAALDAALETARAGGVGRFHGHRFTAKGAHKIWDVVCTRIPGVGSYPPRLLCISRDITEIERIAQARQESEDRFRAIADNIAQFAWMTDETGAIVWYNKRWFEYTGTTMDEVNGWGWKQLHHPHHVDRVVEKFTRCLEAGDDWEDTFPLRGKHGNYRWFLSRARRFATPTDR